MKEIYESEIINKYLNKSKKIGKIIQFIINNPWKTLLISLFFIIIMLPAMKSLRTDFSSRVWFQENDPLLVELDAFERKFGNDENLILVINSKSGIFDKESIELLQDMTEDMWKVTDVIRVDSLFNFNWVHGKGNQILVDPLLEPENGILSNEFLQERKTIALQDEIIPGYLLSRDATTTAIYAKMKPPIVDYKKVIRKFIHDGKINDTVGKFQSKIIELKKNDSGEVGSFLEKINSEREAHYLQMIKKIQADEVKDKTLLSYNKIVPIVKEIGQVEFKTQAKFNIDMKDLAKDDYNDLLNLLIIAEEGKSPSYQKIIEEARAIKEKYEKIGDHQIYITGDVFLIDTFRESSSKDMGTIIPIVLLMIIIFLFITFKKIWGFKSTLGILHSVKGIFFSLLIVILSIISTISIMAFLGFKFTNATANIPQILIAIGIAVSIHLLITFYQFLRKGFSKHEAAFISLNKNFIPTFLTSFSTAIGFFTFITAKVAAIAYFGVVVGIGVMIAWIFSYTILGSLMIIFPTRVKIQSDIEINKIDSPSDFSIKVTNLIYKYRKPIFAFYGILTIFAGILCFQLEINSDPYEYFKKGSEVRQGLDFMEKSIGGALSIEIVIDSGKEEGVKDPKFLQKVDEYQDWLNERKDSKGNKYVSKTISIIDTIKSVNRTLNGGKKEFYTIPEKQDLIAQELFLYTMNLPQGMDINDRITVKNDAMRITLISTMHDSKSSLVEINAYKEKAEKLGLNARITGKGSLNIALVPYLVEAFIYSIISALIIMSILLIIAFRSISLGLLSMIPNVIPLVCGAGLVQLLGYTLDVGIVLVFSIGLGIAVDDTIHFLANQKLNLSHGFGVKESIARIYTFTGPALISTSVVLVASFGMFVIGTFIPNINFGIFTAFILAIALIADLTLTPALLMSIKIQDSVMEETPDVGEVCEEEVIV